MCNFSYCWYLEYIFVFHHSSHLIFHISLILERIQKVCIPNHSWNKLLCWQDILLESKLSCKLHCHSEFSEVNRILQNILKISFSILRAFKSDYIVIIWKNMNLMRDKLYLCQGHYNVQPWPGCLLDLTELMHINEHFNKDDNPAPYNGKYIHVWFHKTM